jgi:hypothetical protein
VAKAGGMRTASKPSVPHKGAQSAASSTRLAPWSGTACCAAVKQADVERLLQLINMLLVKWASRR